MTRFLYLLLPFLLATGCGSEDDSGLISGPPPTPAPEQSFDRGALLAHYADSVITPAWMAYLTEVDELAALAATQPTDRGELRAAFQQTYLGWQRLFPVLTEPGFSADLVARTNFYPYPEEYYRRALATGTLANDTDDAPLATLPTIEFALYGLTDAEYASADPQARQLVAAAARQAADLARQTFDNHWGSASYRNQFVANTASSSNGSIDGLVNDWLFTYERYLRAGKVGIPAGVFSGTALPTHAEALFQENVSRTYLEESLRAMQVFFDGGDATTHDLADYLDALDVRRDGQLLSGLIREQFTNVFAQIDRLNTDLETQVRTDNTEMLRTFDEMQRLLVLLKIDLLQALSINVDYVDADGD